MKKFTRTIEDFVCEHCGHKVKGTGYTNHCPKCLFSKHADNNPGDRMNECQGMMKPVGYLKKDGQEYIRHRCLKCRFEKNNGVESNDNYDIILKLSVKG